MNDTPIDGQYDESRRTFLPCFLATVFYEAGNAFSLMNSLLHRNGVVTLGYSHGSGSTLHSLYIPCLSVQWGAGWEGLPAPHTQPLTAAAACSAMPIAPGNIVATHTLIQPIAQILEWSATDGRSPWDENTRIAKCCTYWKSSENPIPVYAMFFLWRKKHLTLQTHWLSSIIDWSLNSRNGLQFHFLAARDQREIEMV